MKQKPDTAFTPGLSAAAVIAAALAVSGCAMTPVEAQSKAFMAADWELCYFTATGRGPELLRQAVREQMQSRRVDCNQHAAMMQARAAADGARVNNSLLLLQAGQAISRPPTPVVPAPTVCTTTALGGVMTTTCR